ncbi:hypothetical protein CNMCM5623_003911 [Aspergillus felis]|uniref:Uncharacterized protein n=1 Tax=Aspergillus felis TaxID=1287682 RepID=A0A8H6PQR2_9EURO|nr:hypothetical protein CNMCM5623_003911 [Aspergillus felis]
MATSDQGVLAYAQWVCVIIENKSKSMTATVGGAYLKWGKFYKDGDKDKEIPPSDVDKIEIPPGQKKRVYSCGRSDASSGTEGGFKLYDGKDKKEDKCIGEVYWDCPWGSKTNTFNTTPTHPDDYNISNGPYNQSGGALGDVDVYVSKVA